MKQTAPVSTAIVFLLALNLRPAVTSLGAALEDVSLAPGMTAAVGAVLVALPLWASGIGGWITPWLRARIGIHRAVTFALIILGISLVARVQSGAEVLIAGTALACLAIAVVGTVLPVLVQPASSRTKASFTLALGAGSTIGALVTPSVVAAFSWQFALAAWALLALVTLHVWQSAPRSSMVFMARALNPRQLFHSRAAWHLTFYFGLVSTLTFLIMGWLPAILRDAGVSASYAGFCLALSMAMGLPMMWLVPFGVHRMRRPGILVVLLAALNGVGVVGLLVMPAVMPWLWSTGLGLGMGGLAMALTTISVRAAGNPDITTALSGMVQGLGYFIAGAGALACGLLHSATGSWELPLIMALFVLCGQVWCGVRAARPVVVAPRPLAELAPAKVERVANGVRVTPKVQPERPTNGVRVTANAEPEPLTNGVRVTAMAEPEPDVTQPVKGVWITAVAELESAKPEPSVTPRPDGYRVFALPASEPDVVHSANGASELDLAQSYEGVRVTAAGKQRSGSGLTYFTNGAGVCVPGHSVPDPEPEVARPVNGVRVTVKVPPEQPTKGVRVTAAGGQEPGSGLTYFTNGAGVPVPRPPEPNLPQPADGELVAGLESDLLHAAADSALDTALSESDVAYLTSSAQVTGPPESESRVTGLSESDVAYLTYGPQMTGPPESEPEVAHVADDAQVTGPPEPESDVTVPTNGVRVTGLSESDVARLTDGAQVTGPPESDLPHSANGVRVTALSGSESEVAHVVDGVQVAGPSGSESDSAVPASGVRGTALSESEVAYLTSDVQVTGPPKSDLPHVANGVPVTGLSESEVAHSTNGSQVTGPPEPESDVTHPANGVRGTALSESEMAYLADGAQVTGPPVSEPDSAVPTNGVRVTALSGSESDVAHLANGAQVTGLPESEPDSAVPTNGVRVTALSQSESEVGHPVNGVRVTASEDPHQQPEPVHLSDGGRGIAVAEATIPLPRQPIGPFVGPPSGAPVAETIHSETATQEG
jgi:MFS transporter, CP family, cyanate transporter